MGVGPDTALWECSLTVTVGKRPISLGTGISFTGLNPIYLVALNAQRYLIQHFSITAQM